MLLLKFQIPRLGEWLIAQGYINCLEKNQWLCTFRLCENIYSYMWKHRFGKGGVEESKKLASCSSCHKIKSHAPSKQRDKNELFQQVARLHRGPLHQCSWIRFTSLLYKLLQVQVTQPVFTCEGRVCTNSTQLAVVRGILTFVLEMGAKGKISGSRLLPTAASRGWLSPPSFRNLSFVAPSLHCSIPSAPP